MATGLEAFSLACNIMQVISFARELISTSKAIYRGQSPDATVAITAKGMSEAFEALTQSLDQTPKPVNKEDKELADVATKCQDAAAALQAEVNKTSSRRAEGSRTAAISGTVRWILKRGKIESLEKVLRAQLEVMEQGLLHRIW